MFRIPKSQKDLNSQLFLPLLPITPSDIDVDRMMPQLLEMCVHSGYHQKSKTKKDEYETYLGLLVESRHVVGLEPEQRREVLDGWIRASIVKIGLAGLKRDRAIMDYPRPITIATYRAGLPKTSGRNRHADDLVYLALIEELRRRDSQTPAFHLAELVKASFGDGIDVGNAKDGVPTYDGKADIDVSAVLALRFFEVFPDQIPASAKTKEKAIEIAVPGAVDPIGRDCIDFLQHYGPKLSTVEGTSHLAGLIAIRLFELVLRTGMAVRQLYEGGGLSADFRDGHSTNPLQIYCDFTAVTSNASSELARKCVQRDLEVLRKSLTDRLLLRSLYLAGQMHDAGFRELADRPIAERFEFVVDEMHSSEMAVALRMQVRQIKQDLPDGPEGDEGREFIEEMWDRLDAPDLVTQVLVEGLQKDGMTNQAKWFWSTGGLNKPYGLLAGNVRKTSWVYRLSDDLLVTLIMSCFVVDDGNRTQKVIGIADLLIRLKEKFGILVDRPPDMFDSADARSAASENREAFVQRLQLLGLFEGLSDDFSAQFVLRPREAVTDA